MTKIKEFKLDLSHLARMNKKIKIRIKKSLEAMALGSPVIEACANLREIPKSASSVIQTFFTVLLLLFFIFPVQLHAQDLQIDSLKQLLQKTSDDKQRVDIYNKLAICLYYDELFEGFDQAQKYTQSALELSRKINYKIGEEIARANQSILNNANVGVVPDSVKTFEFVELTKKINYPLGLGIGYDRLSGWYASKFQRPEAEFYLQSALKIFREEKWLTGIGSMYEGLGVKKRRLAPNEALAYLDTAQVIAKQVHNRRLSSQIFIDLGTIERENSNYPEAFKNYLQAIHEANIGNSKGQLFQAYQNTGNIYRDIREYDKALENYQKGSQVYEKIDITDFGFAFLFVDIGEIYALTDDTSLALEYFRKSLRIARSTQIFWLNLYANSWITLYGNGKNYPLIISQLKEQIDAFAKNELPYNVSQFLIKLAAIYIQNNQFKEARLALNRSETNAAQFKDLTVNRLEIQYDLYKRTGQHEKALESFEAYQLYKEEIAGRQKATELAGLTFQNQIAQQEQENQQLKKINDLNESQLKQRNTIIYITIAGVLLLLVLAFILWRNNQLKRRTNVQLASQRDQISATLTDLKNTQAQLIQSEKMASLGELTAGIAHEIQNPLNFVNNFSEVNDELLDEMNNEPDIAEVKAIGSNVKENNAKIALHGKRADAIVKNMLEHSRSGKGEKQLTDINGLCVEYLRLAYQSVRSKDENFNCELRTDFDKDIGKINIVPQDIGRVLLNLFNNAFYACAERTRNAASKNLEGFGNPQGLNTYKPVVSVTTKKLDDKIAIGISDNGNGIPDSIKDKIFQPFFTTKPTGSGTGLGLSLSYDIVKTYGGEMKVETENGEGATFRVTLPR